MKKCSMLLFLLMASLAGHARADESAIQASLKKLGLLQVETAASPLKGIKTVLTENGVLYVSEDGKHFIQGPLYDISGTQPVNVTNNLLENKVNALASDMIVYKAAKQKNVITVFTDITCGYCRKLHEKIADYTASGITVRYLAFPRQGNNSPTEKTMKAVWCAADRNKALDAAFKGEQVTPTAGCRINLDKQYELGVMYGIQGTPAILLDNGMLIPGYQGPEEMRSLLDNQQRNG